MERTEERFDRVKAAMAVPAMVLSLVLIPIIVCPMMFDLTGQTLTILGWLGFVIWVLFAVEFAFLFALAPRRTHMVRTHLFELFLVVIPVFRPLRALRVVRLLRAGAGIAVLTRAVRVIATRKAVQGYGAVLAIVLSGGSLLVYLAERDHADGNIDSLGDAVWWSLATCTTVGYGDHYPVTAGGRFVGLALMVLGVGLLSVVTASVAAYFVDTDDDTETAELRSQLADLNAKLDLLLERS